MNNLKKTHEGFKPEKIFLVLAIVFGLAFAILQPLFIEPDSSYHFDHAMYISDTVVNRAAVGLSEEDYQSEPIPFTTISNMMKEGTYFKNFFETKLPLIPKDKAVGYSRLWTVKWYTDVMHWVPALGVKLGYAIYPSIGSMEITARLLNLVFFIAAMYFIIKKMRAYRLLLAAISLTPTVIQMATSLSYDCFNYVIFSFMVMTLLNLAVDIKEGKSISLGNFVKRIAFPSLLLYVTKANSYLLYFLVILFLLYLIGKKLNISLSKVQLWIVGLTLIMGSGILFLIRYHADFHLIISKFFYTLLEPYYTVLTTEVIGGTNTAGLPAWLFPIQFTMLILLFLSYEKERIPRWIAWSCFLVAVLNLVGILFIYSINPSYTEHVITGPQGRYFTNFLILLAPAFTIFAQKVSIQNKLWLKRLVISVSAVVLAFNLGITSVKFYHSQLPADEYRSGVEHYIFK